MDSVFDVIIVGAGLAGGCLALELAKTKLKVALIENHTRQQRYDAPTGDRALALAAGSAMRLEKLGVWQAMQDFATPIKQINVSDQGHFGKARLSAHREGVAALGYVITARIIEDHVAGLIENTHIQYFCPARIVGISCSATESHVSIKQGNESLLLTAKLVVGADGGQSSVRKLMDIEQDTTDYHQSALVTTVKSSKFHAYTAYERFTSTGPLALLPTNEGQSSVVWTRSNEQAAALMAGSETDFIAELQNCFGFRLGQLTLTAPRRVFPLHLIRARSIYKDRVLIIGNAAHQLHPVAGQGFNLGLRDVTSLATHLTNQHLAGHDLGEAQAMQTFVSKRIKDHHRVINFTDSLVKLFSNRSSLLALARNSGITLLDNFPPAKHYLSQHAMGMADVND